MRITSRSTGRNRSKETTTRITSQSGKKSSKRTAASERFEEYKQKSSKKGEQTSLSGGEDAREDSKERSGAEPYRGDVNRRVRAWSTISVVAIAAAIAISFMPAKRRDRAASCGENTVGAE